MLKAVAGGRRWSLPQCPAPHDTCVHSLHCSLGGDEVNAFADHSHSNYYVFLSLSFARFISPSSYIVLFVAAVILLFVFV